MVKLLIVALLVAVCAANECKKTSKSTVDTDPAICNKCKSSRTTHVRPPSRLCVERRLRQRASAPPRAIPGLLAQRASRTDHWFQNAFAHSTRSNSLPIPISNDTKPSGVTVTSYWRRACGFCVGGSKAGCMPNSLLSSPCKEAGGELVTAKDKCSELSITSKDSVLRGVAGLKSSGVSDIAAGGYSLALRGLSAAKQAFDNNGGNEMAAKAQDMTKELAVSTLKKVSSTKHQEEARDRERLHGRRTAGREQQGTAWCVYVGVGGTDILSLLSD